MEIRILAPTGALGAGSPAESLERGVALRPHVIACDAGSTDSGPYYLGAGQPKLSREAVGRDLRLLLKARDTLGVPLIIGSCGTSGRDVGVELVADIAHHDRAEAVKVSMPRPVRQGDIRDADSYGGQWYAPLVDLEVPMPVTASEQA